MHMKILPILFSSLVPVENINILINYTIKSEYDAKEREKNIYLLEEPHQYHQLFF